MTDVDVAVAKLRALAGAIVESELLTLVHAGRPVPKERVRYNARSRAFFTSGRNRRAEGEVLRAFREAWQRRPPLTDTIAIVALFYVPTRQRKDVDNLMKLVMDAATKARVWRDDSQVVVQASVMELDPDYPRTVVALCPCLGTLTRTPLLLDERT